MTDEERTIREEYADDPVTLAEILAIMEGESQGDRVPVGVDGKPVPPEGGDEHDRPRDGQPGRSH